MIVDLDIPFSDTQVSDLRLVWGQPDIPVLDTIEIPDWAPDAHLSLRLLGASHQAVVTTPDGQYAETLACLPGPGQTPPQRAQTTIGGWQFSFTYDTHHLAPAELAARCAQLRRSARHDDHALLGRFPGHQDALTWLHTTTDPHPRWSTVHAYPETGAWVHTTTTMTPERGTHTLSTTDNVPHMPPTTHPRKQQ